MVALWPRHKSVVYHAAKERPYGMSQGSESERVTQSRLEPRYELPQPACTKCMCNMQCTTAQDAIERLQFNLTISGGSLEDGDEPGLPPNQRHIEDNLRKVIRFLQTLMAFLFMLEAAAPDAPFMTKLFALL